MPETSMPKTYDFASTEQRLYDWWWKNGWFKPEAARDQSAEPFVISIPPPNVTGELHWGHAMFVSVEDLMIRYARMKGYRALWVPGMDHAGIATQLQVEKHLLRTEEVPKTNWVAKNSSSACGTGRPNTAVLFKIKSAAWAPHAIGTASASRSTPDSAARCVKPSCACTTKA